MKRIRIFLAIIVAVAAMGTALGGLRQTSKEYEGHTSAAFTRITSYNPLLCVTATNTWCIYQVVFKAGFTPPATLPADLLTNPPASVQSVTPMVANKRYSGS